MFPTGVSGNLFFFQQRSDECHESFDDNFHDNIDDDNIDDDGTKESPDKMLDQLELTISSLRTKVF